MSGEAFGQSVPALAVYIRKVVERYAKEEILKELLQNAEDAAAKELSLTLDLRSWPTDSLLHPDLNACQGPALVAHNDAPFTAEDWANIQSTERSFKSASRDQIGKFGIGFNAVYHLTDLPWIASGDVVGVFDPQESGVFQDPVSRRPAPGRRWTVSRDRDAIARDSPDQFAPFPQVAAGSPVHGTVFRFPLRTTPSQLSPETWTAEKVESELFPVFLREAPHLLLFLSSLSSVRLLRWEPGAAEPRLLFRLRADRSGTVSLRRESSFLRVSMVEEDWREGGEVLKRQLRFAVQHRIQEGGGGELETLAGVLKALPWVAVAAELGQERRDGGRVFCFLPLPSEEPSNSTGLPVHVHGAFALTDSRRTLAHHHHSDTRSAWNRLLMGELVPRAYAELLAALQSPAPSEGHLRPASAAEGRWCNELWPQWSSVADAWRGCLAPLFGHPSAAAWSDVLASFVPLSTAHFHSPALHTEEDRATVEELCRAARVPLVSQPDHLGASLAKALPGRTEASLAPEALAALLHRQPHLLSGRAGDLGASLKHRVLDLLCRPKASRLLHGLRLLPLANDSFCEFASDPPSDAAREGGCIYSVGDEALVALLSDVHDSLLGWEWRERLGFLLDGRRSQLVAFDAATHLPLLLAKAIAASSDLPTLLPKIWDYLNSSVLSLAPLSGLTLLAKRDGSGKWTPRELDSQSPLLQLSPGDESHAEWLLGLGVGLLHSAALPTSHPDLGSFLCSSDQPHQLLRVLRHYLPTQPSLCVKSHLASLEWLRNSLARLEAAQLSEDDVSFLRQLPLFPDARSPDTLVSASDSELEVLPKLIMDIQLGSALGLVEWERSWATGTSRSSEALAGLLQLTVGQPKDVVRALLRASEESEAVLDWLFLHRNELVEAGGWEAGIVSGEGIRDYLRELVMRMAGPEGEAERRRYSAVVAAAVEAGEAGLDWASLSGVPSVLCDRGYFHLPFTVLPNIPYARNVCPFLCRPHDSLPERFLSLAGVRASLSLWEKAAILKAVWIEHRSQPLPAATLDFAVEVIDDVARNLEEETEQEPRSSADEELDVFLPSAEAVLRRPEELVVGGGDAERALHPLVYKEVGLRLGVRSEAELELETCVDGGDWGAEFGQEVDLVSRITRLLDQYHGEQDFLQEFLQNADDAGASELCVTLDLRTHPSEAIFSEAWAPLQGPALLIWNDAVFSQTDLEGIQRLGIGSKAAEAGKIGRFGAGFNCAYRYTDCPHFLSDDAVLCIFDPLRRYIARGRGDRPGKRLNLAGNSRFRRTFAHSYDALSACGKPLRGATVFRLPLRSLPSPLASRLYSPEQMTQLLRDAGDAVRRMLLFLPHIRSVSAAFVDSRGLRHRLWEASAKVRDAAPIDDFLSSRDFRARLRTAADKRSRGLPSSQPTSRCAQLVRLSLSEGESGDDAEEWLVSQRLGFQSSETEAEFPDVKLVPLGGAAVWVGGSGGPRDGLFCSLPLPTRTSLPVVIQGQLCLDEARKTATPASASLGFRWNELLRNEVMLGSYLDLLVQLGSWVRRSDAGSLSLFWDAFPCLRTVHSDWAPFARLLYKAVVEGQALVPTLAQDDSGDPDRLRFTALDDLCYFPDTGGLAELISAMGIRLVALDADRYPDVREALVEAGAQRLTPAIVAELLRNGHASVSQTSLPCPLTETSFARLPAAAASPAKDPFQRGTALLCRLLEYLSLRPPHLTVNDRWALNLFGLPLKLTQDGQLDVFEDSLVFAEPREVSALFQASGRRFLHASLVEALAEVRGKVAGGGRETLNFAELSKLLKDALDPSYEAKDDFCLPLSVVSEDWLYDLWKLLLRMFGALKAETDTADLYASRAKRATAPLAVWKILPIRQSCDLDLAPFSLARFLIAPGTEEERVLTPLGVPVFADNFSVSKRRLSALDPWFQFKHLLANDFSSGIKALGHWNDKKAVEWDAPGQSPKVLLEYLSNHSGRIDAILSSIIKRFPIFKTLEGGYERADSTYPVYVFPEAAEMGLEGRERWSQGVVLLARIPVLDQLYDRLGLGSITLPRVLSSYLVPSLPGMALEDRLSQLRFLSSLKTHPAFGEKALGELMSQLRETAFVSAGDGGRLYRVSHFHDHRVKLFRAFLSGDQAFLPPPFLHAEIPDSFNAELGLKAEGSPTEFSEFASALEEEEDWETAPRAYQDRCQTFLASLAAMGLDEDGQPLPHFRHTLDETSRSRIFPPADPTASRLSRLVLDDTSVKGTEGRVCMRGSLVFGCESLVWTASPVLAAWACERPALTAAMGALSRPSVSQVLAHVHRLFPPLQKHKLRLHSATGLNSPNAVKLLQIVVTDVLQFFQDELGVEEDEEGKAKEAEEPDWAADASRIPFILTEDGRRLASAQMLVFRMPDYIEHQRIPPFLWELPNEYRGQAELFRAMRVAETVGPAHFVRTLVSFAEAELDAGNPNVAEAIVGAERGLLRTGLADPEGLREILRDVEELPLLGADRSLRPAHTLLLRDKELGQELSLNEVFWLPPDEDLLRIKELVRALPSEHRPQLLSELVMEEVDHEGSILCQEEPCELRGRLAELLHSKEFRAGLDAVLRLDGGEETGDETWRSGAVSLVAQAQVLCFELLETQFSHRLHGASVGSRAIQSQAHFSPTSQTLSVLHSAADSARLGASLTRALRTILPLSSFDSALLLQQLLEGSGTPELPANPECPTKVLGGPKVGEVLDSGAMDELLLSSSHFYGVGELVGYLVPGSDEDRVTVILARVTAILESSPQAHRQKYRLSLTSGPHMSPNSVEASALDLFKFARKGEPLAEEDEEELWEDEDGDSQLYSHSITSLDSREGHETSEYPTSALVESRRTSQDLDKTLEAPRIEVRTDAGQEAPPSKASPGDSALDSDEEAPSPTRRERRPAQSSSNSKALVAHSGRARRRKKAVERKPATPAEDPRTDAEIVASLKQQVAEAFKLPVAERKKLVRRLLLQWHPDKNPARDTHEIFVKLKEEIANAEAGGMDEDWYEKWWAAWKSGGKFPSSKGAKGGGPSASSRPNFSKPNFKPPPKKERPEWRPNDALAARYWAQALHDKTAAEKMGQDLDFGSELVVYTATQAVEKVLKAALLKTKGSADGYSNLRHLSALLLRYEAAEECLKGWVEELLWRCDADQGRLRYPDFLPAPAIPHSHFTLQHRRHALQLTHTITDYFSRKFTF